MAAVAGQVLAACVERAEQVESGDRSARPPPPALGVEADQHRRHAMALDHARCAIPTTPGCQPSPASTSAGAEASSSGELAAGPLRGIEHLALGIAALAVGAVELGRDRRGPLAVRGQHQLDPGVGAVEAPGGVDPRGEPEGQIALVEPVGLHGGELATEPAARRAAPFGQRARPARTRRGSRPRSGTRSATVASATQVELGPLGLAGGRRSAAASL